jgi:DNA polymerase (family 10)
MYLGGRTEEEIFSLLKIQYIPPELREDRGEIEAALKESLPRIIELKNIKGDFHVHSEYSDGNSPIFEIAKAAEELNYQYIGICDHSQSLRVANGLSKKEVYKKIKEIGKLNGKSQVRLLCGTEVDIDAEGRLDYPDSILKEFDLVIAAIHSGFKQSKQQLTKRIVNACKNKYVNIIAHPTGRLWGMREPYEIDLDEVLKAANDYQVALEISCFPQRLDLNDIGALEAKKLGVKLALGTDAHKIEQLNAMELGISVARRGWLEQKDIINCMNLEKLMKWLKK